MKAKYWNFYFIVDFSNVRKIRYYPKGIPSRHRAREIIDHYLGAGDYVILSGKEVENQGLLPFRHTPFSVFLPKEKRKNNPGRRQKRDRLKGLGLVTHKFKRVWKEMPTDPKERKKIHNKRRTVIRTQILK